MTRMTRRSLRLAGALAGAAVVGLTLFAGAGAASAKTGSYGYEYICMDTDTDPGCWQQDGPKGAGTGGLPLGWSMNEVSLTGSDWLPNGTEVLRFDTNSGNPATDPMARDMSTALNMACDPSGATVFCR
jgi:hypothetical protein